MSAAKSVTANFTQAPVNYPLSVSKSGNGTITSNPSGINCGADCSETYPSGTTITLFAYSDSGWQFDGWSGACSGTNPCSVSMDGAKSVTAIFSQTQATRSNLYYSTTYSGYVNGGSTSVIINPGGTNCGTGCSSYLTGTMVSLTASSNYGYTFLNWSGDCWGANPCILSMTSNRTVTANFATAVNSTLSVTKTGSGSIISNPYGIECGSNCSFAFQSNSTVSLIAIPDKGFTFVGWDGACSGRGSCSVYMGANQSVSAKFVNTFILIQPAIQLLLE